MGEIAEQFLDDWKQFLKTIHPEKIRNGAAIRFMNEFPDRLEAVIREAEDSVLEEEE
jgi:hypothetical protein